MDSNNKDEKKVEVSIEWNPGPPAKCKKEKAMESIYWREIQSEDKTMNWPKYDTTWEK